MSSPAAQAPRRALRAIAVFEAVKGLVALVAILGLLELLHHDVRHVAEALLWRLHLDPGARYPQLLLHYADLLAGIRLQDAAPLAAGYIALRWLEAYGLWKDRAWGEWLGALSGVLYLPLEAAHLMHRPTVVNAAVLLANLVLVGFLALRLWRRQHRI